MTFIGRRHEPRAGVPARLIRAGRWQRFRTSKEKQLRADTSSQSQPWSRLQFQFEEEVHTRLRQCCCPRSSQRTVCCGPQARIASIPRLYPNRCHGIHVEEMAAVTVAQVAAIDYAPIRLLEPVSVDRMVKEREIGEQIEPVVLGIGIGEAAHPAGRSGGRSVGAAGVFPPSLGSMDPTGRAMHRAARNGISPEPFHCDF